VSMDEATRIAIAALADGTLDDRSRDELLARVETSPELQRAMRDQRYAQAMIASTPTRAPAALHFAVARLVDEARTERAIAEEGRTRRSWRRQLATPRRPRDGAPIRIAARPRTAALALGGGLATFAAALAVLAGGGGPAGPSIAEAAQAALSPAMRGAPAVQPGTLKLKASIDGIAYPYWEDSAGWDAVGTRRDEVSGRRVMTVIYADDHGHKIGYAIASGAPLSAGGGHVVEQGDARLRVLSHNGATIVTWLRDGHTCILAAHGVDEHQLIDLASWET
jgi:hypothetical protein